MKAAVCRTFSSPLSIEDVNLAKPTGEAVKIQIKACAICHSDISYMKGYWGGELPLILGHEAAGIVTEVGENVHNVKPNDRVVVTLMRSCGTCATCNNKMEAICETPPAINSPSAIDAAGNPIITAMNSGTFAEEVLVHQRQVITIPDDMDFAPASLLGCGVITGFGSVMRVGKIQKGDEIAVIGSGGIGGNAIQAARISGASKIIAIDTAADKETLARQLGATDFINASGGGAVQKIMDLTNGRGCSAVFVAVGASSAIESAIPMVAAGGKIIIMGMPASDDLARIDASDLAGSAKSIIGTKMGSAMIRDDIPMLIDLYQKGELILDDLISHRFDFGDINQAIDMAASPASARVLIDMQN